MRLFGFTGELAAQSMSARRKSFRSSTAAVCISFVLVGGMLCMMEIAALSNRQTNSADYYDVTAMLYFVENRDDELVEKIRNIPGVTESVVNSAINLGLMVNESDAAENLAAIGGFASIDGNRYNIVKRDGGYRIGATLYGIDDRSFAEYCALRGLDPKEYLNTATPRAIIQNVTNPYWDAREEEKREFKIELLRLHPGDKLTLLEQAYDDMNTNHSFDVTVGYVETEPVPQINGGQLTNFRPVVIVPLSQYDKIVADFMPERAANYRRANVNLVTGEETSLETEKLAEEIAGEYLGSEDYVLWSKEGWLKDQTRMNNAVKSMDIGIAVMIALIGISNAFSSVAASLRIRRREFAMLRSVGLNERGLNKLLLLEGLYFSIRPLLLGLPFICLICQFFLWITDISWTEYLPVLPAGGVMLYAFAALLLMGLAYMNGARDIRGAVIVDTLRDETV
jgi:putative ABC transport system permease protein